MTTIITYGWIFPLLGALVVVLIVVGIVRRERKGSPKRKIEWSETLPVRILRALIAYAFVSFLAYFSGLTGLMDAIRKVVYHTPDPCSCLDRIMATPLTYLIAIMVAIFVVMPRDWRISTPATHYLWGVMGVTGLTLLYTFSGMPDNFWQAPSTQSAPHWMLVIIQFMFPVC